MRNDEVVVGLLVVCIWEEEENPAFGHVGTIISVIRCPTNGWLESYIVQYATMPLSQSEKMWVSGGSHELYPSNPQALDSTNNLETAATVKTYKGECPCGLTVKCDYHQIESA